MMRVMLAIVCSAGAACAGGWPKVEYKGKARSSEWLTQQYEAFKDKIAMVEGTAVDLGHFDKEGVPEIGKCMRGAWRH
jgi:hypothetical protein